MERNLRNKKRSDFYGLRVSKEFRKAILEHGAYHDANIDRIVKSGRADQYYTDDEKHLLHISLIHDHFKVQKLILKEVMMWFTDKDFISYLQAEEPVLFEKLKEIRKNGNSKCR